MLTREQQARYFPPEMNKEVGSDGKAEEKPRVKPVVLPLLAAAGNDSSNPGFR